MKCSLGISNFLEEICSLSHSVVFLYFFALIAEEGFLISSCYSLELCIQMLMLCYAKSLQLCPTLCDPIDGSPPGSPVPGILQARTLEWVAISLSNPRFIKLKRKDIDVNSLHLPVHSYPEKRSMVMIGQISNWIQYLRVRKFRYK